MKISIKLIPAADNDIVKPTNPNTKCFAYNEKEFDAQKVAIFGLSIDKDVEHCQPRFRYSI
ncbi:hypothetical protein OH492_27685 [Vibrio chagasii]|nr:hypothetical protein [Vibrio chagasii]